VTVIFLLGAVHRPIDIFELTWRRYLLYCAAFNVE